MIIAIDFDGTCVTHEFPAVGKDIGAIPVLKKLTIEHNHRLILFTMRSGDTLKDAVEWFYQNGIPLWGVNTNPEQNIWTESPKAYAEMYIDDAALGIPLIWPGQKERVEGYILSRRPYVDWEAVDKLLEKADYFDKIFKR